MRFFIVLCVLAAVCTAWANPSGAISQHALARQRRQLGADLVGSTAKLIQTLVSDLHGAAQNAKDAIAKFNNGLIEQGKKIRDKFTEDVNKLRDRVLSAINALQDKFTDSGSGIRECVDDLRENAEAIFNEAQTETTSCANEKIKESAELIKNLSVIGDNGQALATEALAEMNACTTSSDNIIATGACLGSVAVRTELKTAKFLVQSGLAIGRVNLNMATLPASLEVCAGSNLVKAGVATGRILMELSSCSTNSVISNFGADSSDSSSPAVSLSAESVPVPGKLPSINTA